MTSSAHHIHMVALILIGSSSFCEGETRAYKVRDSNEEYADAARTGEYTRSFAPDDNSGAFYGAGFHFPDFFNDGRKEGEAGGFGVGPSFGSPFPSFSESRSSDSSYIVPAGTYRTAYDVRSKTPVSRSHAPAKGEYRQKNPILTLYDDWSPDEQPRNKWTPDQPRNTKWSQEHTDDDSSEASSPVAPYKGQLSGPYRGTGSYSRPYSESSLKQHYKPINPPGNTHLPGQGDVRTHAHKYGVNHVYDRRKKPEEPNYDQYDENLNNRKPQQFSPNPNPHRSEKLYRQNHPSQYQSQTYPSEYRSQSRPRAFHDRNFSPSQPDFFRNSKNFDFFTDSSNTAPTKIKAVDSDSSDDPDRSEDSERPKDQLDKSCEESNKTTTINLSDGKISLQCYDCYDTNYKRPYEQCVEVPDEDRSSRRKKRSVKTGSVAQAVPSARGKRQHDDYYDGDGNYGPDSNDYRFGPEHFADDYGSSYDDGEEGVSPEHESEKCHKSKKGDMLCISCENKNTGGTYQQCSYASDPKKNSYERSVSKAFGSPRIPEENRRKQVEGVPRKASVPKRKPNRVRGTGYIDPSGPSSYPRGTSGYSSGSGGYDDESAFRNPHLKRKVPSSSLGGTGQTSRHRGSQGRSPLPTPVRGIPRERLFTKTPASTTLKGPSRMGLESNLKTAGKNSYLPKRNPPPASRAYSTPSPVGPDPYSYDLPDPYNPNLGNGGGRGSQNRKNIDASYEPGYDETFADLFPELIDTDPKSALALAPPSYDEYSDTYSDYDDAPVRRRDQDSIQNGSKIHSTPSTAKLPENIPDQKLEPKKQKICKRVRKNKMNCLQCVDEKGAKQEECSYGTDPKSKHMTYREVKEMRYEPSQQNPERVGSPEDLDKKKRKFKKYNPEERYATKNTNLEQKVDRANDRNDRQNNTFTPSGRNSPSRHRGEAREKREEAESPEERTDAEIDKSTRKNYNPIPTDPPELDNFGEKMSEDGEFSADTEMKFDPALGMSLPKYMLDKSEGEAIFDEVLGSSYKDE